MRIVELLNNGTAVLSEAEIDNSAYDSRSLLKYVFDLDETGLIIKGNDEADPEKSEEYMRLIGKRAEHYPLQYIMHSTGFMDYEFYVDENVLIPRSDTEILVEEVLKYLNREHKESPVRLLDMCTGSGCIGISCFLERKEKGVTDDVTLADISEGALSVAGRNAGELGADVNIVKSDIYNSFDSKSHRMNNKLSGDNDVKRNTNEIMVDYDQAVNNDSDGSFDIIVSNPPYIRSDVIPTLMEEVKDFEPVLALDGDRDGLKFYKKIIGEAPKHLRSGGAIYLEIGFDQYEDTRKLLVDAGFTDIKLFKDLAGLDRVVCGILK